MDRYVAVVVVVAEAEAAAVNVAEAVAVAVAEAVTSKKWKPRNQSINQKSKSRKMWKIDRK